MFAIMDCNAGMVYVLLLVSNTSTKCSTVPGMRGNSSPPLGSKGGSNKPGGDSASLSILSLSKYCSWEKQV
jgi:hypothetical protein